MAKISHGNRAEACGNSVRVSDVMGAASSARASVPQKPPANTSAILRMDGIGAITSSGWNRGMCVGSKRRFETQKNSYSRPRKTACVSSVEAISAAIVGGTVGGEPHHQHRGVPTQALPGTHGILPRSGVLLPK